MLTTQLDFCLTKGGDEIVFFLGILWCSFIFDIWKKTWFLFFFCPLSFREGSFKKTCYWKQDIKYVDDAANIIVLITRSQKKWWQYFYLKFQNVFHLCMHLMMLLDPGHYYKYTVNPGLGICSSNFGVNRLFLPKKLANERFANFAHFWWAT